MEQEVKKGSLPDLGGAAVIAPEQFAGDASLTDIVIPEGVAGIREYAFSACSSLNFVTIPSSMVTLDKGAFNVCKQLTDVFYAGNESDRHYGNGVAKVEEVDGETQEHATKDDFVLVVDTIAPTRTVSYPTPQLIRDRSKNNTVVEADPKTICNEENTDYTLYYDATSPGNIPITIQITEANFDPQDEDLVVELNGQPYEIRWERTDEENKALGLRAYLLPVEDSL